MRFVKRRSVPLLLDPRPSTLVYPVEQSQSTVSLIPSPTHCLLPRSSFRWSGQSARPPSQRHPGHNYNCEPGAEDAVISEAKGKAQTQTQAQERSGSVALSNVYASEDRRPRITSSSSSSLVTAQMDVVGNDDQHKDERKAGGRKRDSTGQNRYPPNSLKPSNGWGFGRMRRTRKQSAKGWEPGKRESLL